MMNDDHRSLLVRYKTFARIHEDPHVFILVLAGHVGPGQRVDTSVAGGPFTYQIAVSVPATGLADAQGVVLDDLLPIGFVAMQASATNALCTITPVVGPGGVRSAVLCSLGTVPGWAGTAPPPPVLVTVHGVLDPDANASGSSADDSSGSDGSADDSSGSDTSASDDGSDSSDSSDDGN